MRKLFALVALASLSGCVSVTEPVSVGKDTYMIGLGARGGLSTDAELMSKTLKSAGEFCLAQNKHIEVQSTSSKGVQMWTPQSNQVIFKCV